MAKIKTLALSYEYNRKTGCHAWVEVRKGEDWASGEPCVVTMQGRFMGHARIEAVRQITPGDVTEMLAALAFGMTETAARFEVDKIVQANPHNHRPLQLLLVKWDERYNHDTP